MPKSTTPTAREREVYRYYQPLEIPTPSAHNKADRDQTPHSSTDPILTAFAQLGAHRLRAKRGLITLSTRDTEYILAESGVGLGLQQDDDKNDPLWHGTVALKENCGLGMDLVQMFCGTDDDALSHVCIPDLTTHPVFGQKCVVVEEPHIRFLACVPLRSPLFGVVLGAYLVVDDKPRDGLSEEEIEFLVDMGVTVMDHLEAQRLNQMQHRSERMVKAIGLFIEGKSTLRDWWLQGGHRNQQSKVKKRSRNNTTLDGQADLEFGVQDPSEESRPRSISIIANEGHSLSRRTSSSTLSHVAQGDGRPGLPQRGSTYSTTDNTMTTPTTMFSQGHIPRNSSVTTFDTSEGTAGDGLRHSSVAFDLPNDSPNGEISKELQEALLTKDLRAVFGRASNLLREAGGVDGTIFFDASIGSFGAASEKGNMDQKAPGSFGFGDAATTSEDDNVRRSSDTDNLTDTKSAESCCNILGYSTRKRSSLRGHAPLPEHHMFPERVLRTLLKRYPHGKVFNFDEDGSFSSSDTDNSYAVGDSPVDATPRRSTNAEAARRKRISKEAEAAAILKALPGARSVFWFPLWDQGRERWYAGSLVWSTCPTRLLCPIEDLTYLAAFGNSIMAEVARLSAMVLTQMKTDFISSISHELRSPLHGVLASVEFLQETEMTEIQTDMVSNINASGRVLLDTINHILDFSKVNKQVKGKGKPSKRRGKKQRLSFDGKADLDNTARDTSDVCVLSEEVVESVHAGRSMSKIAYDTPGSTPRPRSQSTIADSAITIIMDVQYRPNWVFEMDAGAWRRILLNLFGNSMKYTKSGYIRVSLKVEDDVTIRGKRARSMLVLKVKDSGKGISKEFLKNHIYKPFTQEDSLAVGAGLGLSIVRHIIQDLGGDINFTSEQGVGTEATVRLPMTSAIPEKAPDFVSEVRKITRGKKFILEGFDRYPDISEPPTGILPADFEGAMFLKSSMHVLLRKWFDMEHGTATSNDVLILMESGIKNLGELLEAHGRKGSSIAIVLCNSYPSGHPPTSYGNLKVFYAPQPHGPHKVAKVLHHAFLSPAPTVNGSPKPEVSRVLQEDIHHPLPFLKPSIPKPITPPPLDRRISIDTTPIAPPGLRILLVEDNEINLKLLVAYMRKLHLNHSTAINGLDAFNTYVEAKGAFDVIFMDISMPIMSGIESTKHMRRWEREMGREGKGVKIIALTGAANPGTRQEAFAGGVDMFLTKPVPMKSLKIMLDEISRESKGE